MQSGGLKGGQEDLASGAETPFLAGVTWTECLSTGVMRMILQSCRRHKGLPTMRFRGRMIPIRRQRAGQLMLLSWAVLPSLNCSPRTIYHHLWRCLMMASPVRQLQVCRLRFPDPQSGLMGDYPSAVLHSQGPVMTLNRCPSPQLSPVLYLLEPCPHPAPRLHLPFQHSLLSSRPCPQVSFRSRQH